MPRAKLLMALNHAEIARSPYKKARRVAIIVSMGNTFAAAAITRPSEEKLTRIRLVLDGLFGGGNELAHILVQRRRCSSLRGGFGSPPSGTGWKIPIHLVPTSGLHRLK